MIKKVNLSQVRFEFSPCVAATQTSSYINSSLGLIKPTLFWAFVLLTLPILAFGQNSRQLDLFNLPLDPTNIVSPKSGKINVKTANRLISKTTANAVAPTVFTSTAPTSCLVDNVYQYEPKASNTNDLVGITSIGTIPSWLNFTPSGNSTRTDILTTNIYYGYGAITLDSNGNVYVAENRPSSGSFLKIYKITPTGSVSDFGTIPNESNFIMAQSFGGLVIVGNYLYAALYNGSRGGIVQFDITQDTPVVGQVIFSNRAILGLTSFNGDLYASSCNTNEIFKIVLNQANPSASSVDPYIPSSGGLNFPYGLCFNSLGDLYVSNYNSGFVSKFDKVTKSRTENFNMSYFNKSYGVAQLEIDAEGSFYIGSLSPGIGIRKFNSTFSSYIELNVETGNDRDYNYCFYLNSNKKLFYTQYLRSFVKSVNLQSKLSGTPSASDVGTYPITLSASGGASTATQSFNIVVTGLTPNAPTGVSATITNQTSALISFTAPTNNGGSAITGYTVTSSPGGLTATGTSSPIQFTGLSTNVSYTFTVAAQNAQGIGTSSSPSNATIILESDGDGVTDTQEATDGTDPIDACSYLPGSQTIANTSAAWKAADCDGDGTPNGTDSAPLDYCVGRVGFTIPKLGTAAYNNYFKNSDCDGDGISNHAECNGADNPDDFDGDGIPNYLDTDSDNDMMSDRDERRIDSDGDGDADYLDLDSDNDGILDKLEGNADADGDGIKNYLDLDSDGDGILDAWEAAGISEYHQDYNFDGRVSNADGSFPDANGNGLADFLESSMGGKPRGPQDTDKDGIPDYLDLDSDGDSLLDSLEQTYDVDGDGRPNYRDLDSDGDWIADFIDGTMDTDADGTKNFMDLDSDGDGIPDRYEGSAACDNCTGLVDNNNNGWDDRKEMVDPAAIDTDGEGTPDFKDTDSDNDGIPDSVEAGKDPSKPVDTDGDGTPDFRDTDSDNDGIPDSVEAGKDPNKPVDTDGDGKPDYQDLDSDNDGIPDKTEAGKDPSKPVDTDSDGKPDYQDTDSDNDGIPDSVEAGKDPSKPVDTDGDGTPDYQDTDSDNDGIPDSVEAGKDPNKPVDTDGDGKPDYQDTDSDNDGIPDSVEAGKDPSKPVDTDGDGKPDYQDTDSDNDGIPDSVEAGKDPNKPVDTDGDGKPDYQDTDSDNDGIPDAVEAGKDPNKPVDTDGDGKPDYLDTDSDNDGIPDSVEAGKDPQVPVDTDKDGIPDYRDLDSDGDGIPDKIEAGKDPNKPVDTDGDGKPDYQDTDSDNDGIPDSIEAGNVNNPVDTDGDGKPDYQDTDSDGDGIPDKIEAGVDPTKPVDTDGDGTPDYRDLDSDNDGYADKEEAGKDPSNPVDTDKDGKPDYQDTDSDNDGILDKLENDINYGALADCDKDGIDNRIDADQCPTFAPNGISPNGDGKNDVLIIPGILRNQPNELTIFNRWGNIVYQTSNYKNDWGGQTDRAFSLLAGDNLLPDGTYYYVIDFFGKYPNVGTYVYINRQDK